MEVEMDKEIIDDVKVEECSYYNKDNTPYCCEVWDNECEAQNCYYKQLKRLEQENEKFINVTNDSIIEQEKQVARINCLEQENEQLKKENKVNLSRSLDLNREIQSLSDKNAELKAENTRKKDMIERQWKLLKQCGVSAGGELKRVSYLLEKLREENERLKEEKTELEEKFLTLNGKSYSYYTTLQEIKAIASKIIESYIRPYGNYNQLKQIIDLITKAESEG